MRGKIRQTDKKREIKRKEKKRCKIKKQNKQNK